MGTITAEEEKIIAEQSLERRAQFALTLTKYVTMAGVSMAITLGGAWLVFRQYTQLLILAVIIVPMTISAGLFPAFHRRGQTKLGFYVFLLAFFVPTSTVALLLQEAMMSAPVGLVTVVIVGNLLLGDKDSRWLTILCILAFIVDVVLVSTVARNWFVPLAEVPGVIIGAVFCAMAMISTVLIIRIVVIGQEEHFQQSQRANMEVAKRVAAEQERRERLQNAVRKYVAYMEEIAQGKLAARVDLSDIGTNEEDPLVVLGRNLNEMVASVQRMITQIRDAANNLSAATSEILSATTQQASGANEQSAAISQTTATVNQVKTISLQSSEQAQSVVETSQHTVEVSRSGQDAVAETIDSMDEIKEHVEDIAENILNLSEQTQQIEQIIATVNDIAAQSKVLALNASVEAARAGEYGKGFAVVAVEVRNLAEQSRQATDQVRDILSEVQNGINATVMATEEGSKVVEQGVTLAAQTQGVIERLSAVISESADMAKRVMAGGRQQSTGIEQIAQAMQNINQAMSQSMASTRQTEKAAQDLNDLARSLTKLVEQYEL